MNEIYNKLISTLNEYKLIDKMVFLKHFDED